MVWGALCGDGSPYSTVHQVIPGGHVEETVQGELMREQLDNTQVRINSVQGWVIPTASGVEKKKKGRASVEFTLLIVSWSTRADLSQRTKAFTSGLEFFCKANPPSIMHRDHNRSDSIVHVVSNLVDVNTQQKLLACSEGTLQNHYPNGWVKFEHISRWSRGLRLRHKPVRQKSRAWSWGVGGEWLVRVLRNSNDSHWIDNPERAWSVDAILVMPQLAWLLIRLNSYQLWLG